MITMFAIAVEGTDNYLPQINQSRGFSNSEPMPEGGPHGPRLFRTRVAANRAAKAWSIGPWDPVWDHERDEYTGNRNDIKTGGCPRRDPERAKVPLIVVEFELTRK